MQVNTARLKTFVSWHDQREVCVRLALAAAGVMPVSLIAATAFGISDLRTLATRVLVPTAVAAALVARSHPGFRRACLVAVIAGPIATLLYDAFRFAFLAAGLMQGDPIPHIGDALRLEPAWVVGYAWRYLGNGTGLALAFVVLGLRGWRAGLGYGLAVCAGLLLTLAVSPYGQEMLFTLSPASVVMATGGHAIYGIVLGAVAELGRVDVAVRTDQLALAG